MEIILGLLLSESTLRSAFWWKEREKQTKETRLYALHSRERSFLVLVLLHGMCYIRSKVSVGNLNAHPFIPQAFSTISYQTVLYCSQNLLLLQLLTLPRLLVICQSKHSSSSTSNTNVAFAKTCQQEKQHLSKTKSHGLLLAPLN